MTEGLGRRTAGDAKAPETAFRWDRPQGMGVLLSCVLLMVGAAAGCTTSRVSYADSLMGWYREVISPVDGDRCPMYPSCSRYAQEAFSKHGWFWGWMLTSERLMRCGHDEIRLAEPIWTADGPRYVDPVDANDFWWTQRMTP